MIKQLTKEQEEYLPVFRQKYLDIASNGKRIKRDKLESAIKNIYAYIGEDKPLVIILQSPQQAMMAITFMKNFNSYDFSSQLSGQLFGQLRSQRIYNNNYLCGTHDLYWVAWARFAAHIGVKLKEDTQGRLNLMEDISSQCEWWFPYKGVCFVSEKPIEVNWEGDVLHGENKPAVLYQDGYAVYSWRGTNVPKEWIENPETLTPDMAITWENVEQRRCIAEILG